MIEVKKTITNTMFTTGASLVILAAFSMIFGKEFNYAPVVLQIFAANIVINLGLFFLWKFELPYLILQYLLNVGYIILVLVVFGAVFNWYSTVPVWLLAVMAVVIYAFAAIISAAKFRKDTEEINELLQKRKEKKTDTAS
jgi:uncharacterized membrane protein